MSVSMRVVGGKSIHLPDVFCAAATPVPVEPGVGCATVVNELVTGTVLL